MWSQASLPTTRSCRFASNGSNSHLLYSSCAPGTGIGIVHASPQASFRKELCVMGPHLLCAAPEAVTDAQGCLRKGAFHFTSSSGNCGCPGPTVLLDVVTLAKLCSGSAQLQQLVISVVPRHSGGCAPLVLRRACEADFGPTLWGCWDSRLFLACTWIVLASACVVTQHPHCDEHLNSPVSRQEDSWSRGGVGVELHLGSFGKHSLSHSSELSNYYSKKSQNPPSLPRRLSL